MRPASTIYIFVVVVFILGASGVFSQPNRANTVPRLKPFPTPKTITMAKLPKPANDAERLLLKEYGAMFVGVGVALPKKIFFRDEAEVAAFQRGAGEKKKTVGKMLVTLQPSALDALARAVAEATKAGLTITPRGTDASRRGYQQTVDLWASRVEPGLNHWVAKGKISKADALRIRSLSPVDQISEILKLESRGIFFAKSLDKSIIYSVAPPGSSQHLSMLALDVAEFDDARVRAILARNGWFQTVVSDLPHFTYLGAKESELPSLGLKKVINSGRDFWVLAVR